MNTSIFRAYDIRGIYPKELNNDDAYYIGRAYAEFVRRKGQVVSSKGNSSPLILVQSDARSSSPPLKEALIRGLLAHNAQVIDGGLATTPMHYFSINKAIADGGIMITASHNPSQYNGFKLSLKEAIPIGQGRGMEEIRHLAISFESLPNNIPNNLEVLKRNFEDDYIRSLLEKIEVSSIKPFKIVIDAANGMAGLLLPKLIERLPIKVIPLYFEIDMTFPNHEANPMKEETLRDLQGKVKEEGADLGVAFDGDADRIGFVDETGRVTRSDFVGAYLAEWLLEKEPGSKIVYDIRSSRVVPEVIERAGGRAIESRVGHFFIRKILREEQALFGEERTGHFFYRDFFYTGSTLLGLLRLLVAMSEKNLLMSDINNRYQKYFSTGELNFTVKDNSLERLEEIAKQFSDAKKIYWLDGLSVIYDDWWFNLRLANTEPLVRLNIEAKNQELVDEKLKLLKSFILV